MNERTNGKKAEVRFRSQVEDWSQLMWELLYTTWVYEPCVIKYQMKNNPTQTQKFLHNEARAPTALASLSFVSAIRICFSRFPVVCVVACGDMLYVMMLRYCGLG